MTNRTEGTNMHQTEGTGTQHLDCDHCGRTTYWCHCDTHPVTPTPETHAEAVAFLASIGLAPDGERLAPSAPMGACGGAEFEVGVEADQFKAMLSPEIAAKLPDEVATRLWGRLMTEPLPTYLLDIYDSGQANPTAMSTRRARELATNWLIDQQAR